MRYYRVNCYLPPEAGHTQYGRSGSRNALIGIAATDLESAIAETKAMHPLARIDAINDQGKIHNLSVERVGDLLAVAAKPE